MISIQSHPPPVCGAELPDACRYEQFDLQASKDTHHFIVDNAHRALIGARAMHQAQIVAGTQQWDVLDWSSLIASSRVGAGLNPFDSKKVGA